MEPGSPLLALRLGGACYALEPGRDYLLGSADDCDLRIADAAPRHARIHVGDGAGIRDLGGGDGILVNEERVAEAALCPGDRIALAGELMVVVADDGSAALVPIPARSDRPRSSAACRACARRPRRFATKSARSPTSSPSTCAARPGCCSRP